MNYSAVLSSALMMLALGACGKAVPVAPAPLIRVPLTAHADPTGAPGLAGPDGSTGFAGATGAAGSAAQPGNSGADAVIAGPAPVR